MACQDAPVAKWLSSTRTMSHDGTGTVVFWNERDQRVSFDDTRTLWPDEYDSPAISTEWGMSHSVSLRHFW